MEQDNFTVLENKANAIGRNTVMYRKIRGLKVQEVAERLGMKESSFIPQYECGEGAITVDLIQQVAEVFNGDPLMLLSVSPNNLFEMIVTRQLLFMDTPIINPQMNIILNSC
jgi:transcriptional regulator with XRE-family HTH domain